MSNNDLFKGLGGLMKGLSGIMPQDDPNVKMFNAQNELEELKKQELELLAQIGRIAYQKNPSAYEQNDRLRLIQSNIAEAEKKLDVTKNEQQAANKAKEDADNARRCPNCDTMNPEGVKFCQECGTKLGASKAFCPNCGQENAPGTRFCGGCGTKMGG